MNRKPILMSLLCVLSISLGAQISFHLDTLSANTGSQVIVPVRVNNFNEVISAQFTVRFEPTILVLDSVGQFNLNGLNKNSFGFAKIKDGICPVSWFDSNANGISLPDGTTLFELYFTAIGNSGSSSTVELSDDPIKIEITSASSDGDPIPYIVHQGKVDILAVDPTISIGKVWSTSAQSSCLPVKLEGLAGFKKLNATLSWNPLDLNFDSVRTNTPGLNLGQINNSFVTQGDLLIQFNDPSGIQTPNSKVIFEACFTSIGAIGDTFQLSWTDKFIAKSIFTNSPPLTAKWNNGYVINGLNDMKYLIELPCTSPNADVVVNIFTDTFPVPSRLAGQLNFDPIHVQFKSFILSNWTEVNSDSFDLSKVTQGLISWNFETSSHALKSTSLDMKFLFHVISGPSDFKTQANTFASSLDYPYSPSGKLEILTQEGNLSVIENQAILNLESKLALPSEMIFLPLSVSKLNQIESIEVKYLIPAKLKFEDFIVDATSAFDLIEFSIDKDTLTVKAKSFNPFGVTSNTAKLGELNLLVANDASDTLFIKPLLLACKNIFVNCDKWFQINTSIANVVIADPNTLAFISSVVNNPCSGQAEGSITLDVKGGKLPYTFIWNNGGNQAAVYNLKAGNYAVTIIDNSIPSRIINQSFIINDLAIQPNILATDDIQLKCPGIPESVELWNNVFQLELIADSKLAYLNGNTLTLLQEGSIILKYFDANTSCSSFDTVLIISAKNLELANAGADQNVCGQAKLKANLPLNYSGIWTSLDSNISVGDPFKPETQIAGLKPGPNIMIWTLSTSICKDFDSDTVWLWAPIPPSTVPDTLFGNQASIDVLNNDVPGSNDFAFQGFQSFPNGLAFQGSAVSWGSYSDTLIQLLNYSICDEICPEICSDGALVLLQQVINNTTEVILPKTGVNAFTPNADGINDAYFFEELDELNYPDAKLEILNSRGNLVFRANQFQNPWNGTTTNGQQLSADVYYYVLTLDTTKGIYRKGWVAILRSN